MSMTVAIFQDTGWCIGEMYRNIAPHIEGVCFEWSKVYDKQAFDSFDRVLTLAGDGSKCLVKQYGIPRDKILVVAHDTQDVIRLFGNDGNEGIRQYAGFGVVSDTMAAETLAIGVTRIPTVLRGGVDCGFYDSAIPLALRRVGYASTYSRTNEYGVERKRGDLARKAAVQAGLEFTTAIGPTNNRFSGIPKGKMPDYYRSVDAVIMSSLEEGGGMPMLEGAAAGRLTIGTPVGEFPRLAYEGLGILAPLGEEAFVEFVAGQLIQYKQDPMSFQSKCRSIQAAARKRDWSCVISDWIRFVGAE